MKKAKPITVIRNGLTNDIEINGIKILAGQTGEFRSSKKKENKK